MGRDFLQWNAMVARTSPTPASVAALRRELERDHGGLNAEELGLIKERIEGLSANVSGTNAATSTRPNVSIEYRDHAASNKGRLYLEVTLPDGEILEPLELQDNPGLDALEVYTFCDAGRFSGVQVDNANALPERLEAVLAALRGVKTQPLDCLEANLSNVSLPDILRWATQERIERKR